MLSFKIAVVPLNSEPPAPDHFRAIEDWEREVIQSRWNDANVEIQRHPTHAFAGAVEDAASSRELVENTLLGMGLREACTFRGFCVFHRGFWALLVRCLDPSLDHHQDYTSWRTSIESDGEVSSLPVAHTFAQLERAMETFGGVDDEW